MRMLKDVESGRIEALLATRFARVARDGVMFHVPAVASQGFQPRRFIPTSILEAGLSGEVPRNNR
jgi:hypothetical protein